MKAIFLLRLWYWEVKMFQAWIALFTERSDFRKEIYAQTEQRFEIALKDFNENRRSWRRKISDER